MCRKTFLELARKFPNSTLLTWFHTHSNLGIFLGRVPFGALSCISRYLLRVAAPIGTSQSFESSLWTVGNLRVRAFTTILSCKCLQKYFLHFLYQCIRQLHIFSIYVCVCVIIDIIEAERSNNAHLAG